MVSCSLAVAASRENAAISRAIAQSGWVIAVHFSGEDGYEYALQTSADLLNWTTISTNFATNGGFSHVDVPVPELGASSSDPSYYPEFICLTGTYQ
jgi:hypothetical protein